MRKFKQVLSLILGLMVILATAGINQVPSLADTTLTTSQQYAEAMGTGINIGNSFDSFDRVDNEEIDDETAWGNPVVTKSYVDKIKAMGFKSVRLPFTSFTRTDSDYTINETFLAHYEEVVNYALDDGLYVMINLHHDSSEWLGDWDGETDSEEYTRFVALWTQLADRFKDYGDHLMFESINEPSFDNGLDMTDSEKNVLLGTLNQKFYDIVRDSGSNNTTRMLVFPTLYTNHGSTYSDYLADFIDGLDDDYVMATVHFYSVSSYAYTCNMGISMFDEYNSYSSLTARDVIDNFYDALEDSFIDNGIGVVVGEYGLFNMGYNEQGVEVGETSKFIDYFNERAREDGICTMLWDNGSIVNRTSGEFYLPTWQEVVEASMSESSSYATDLDELFISDDTSTSDIEVALTLNGNTLSSIDDESGTLTLGTDYTYDSSTATVTLLGSYLSQYASGDYGQKAQLDFNFSAGATWHEYINYYTTAEFSSYDADVRTDDGTLAFYDTDDSATYPAILIPVDYNGEIIRRILVTDSSGNAIANGTWASTYLQTFYEFLPDYDNGYLSLTNHFEDLLSDGTYTVSIEFYDGSSIDYTLTASSDHYTGQGPSSNNGGGTDENSNVDFTYSYSADWGSGCNVTLSVTNTSGEDITDGWELSFDFPRTVSSVYSATLESYSDGTCVVTNPSWSTTFSAGDTYDINFQAGAGDSTDAVTNCVLTPLD